MVQRFLGKKPFNRYVRPVRHTRSLDKIDMEKVVTETENNDNKDVVDMNTLSVKDRLDCPYSEFIQSLTFPPGEYKLECMNSL